MAKDQWGDNVWSRALRSGETQVLNGPGKVPKGHLPIDCALATPIRYSGETIGVIIVADREGGYGDTERRLLEDLARYVSPVLHEWMQRTFEERARSAAELALKQSEQNYRTLYDQAPVGVFTYGTDGIIVESNEALARMIGAPPTTTRDVVAGNLEVNPGAGAALRAALDGSPGDYDGAYRSLTTGRELWVILRAAPRYDSEGRVSGGVAVLIDRSDLKNAETRMEYLLMHDPSTDLPNRALFSDRVTQALAHADRRRLGLAVAVLELDRFQTLADTLGHEAAEHLAAAAAKRVVDTTRIEDTVARVGSGEFALLFPGIGGPAEASAAIEKVRAAFADPFTTDTHELYLTLSLGVAVYPADGVETEELVRNAETAARRATGEGGDRWQFYHAGMNEERSGRLEMEAELRHALERREFVLHYQPQVDARDGTIVAVEALLRWQHPERGLVPPLDFIPLAEDTGLMVPIGAWALRAACEQATAWASSVGATPRVAVNLSARQLLEHGLEELVAHVVADTGLPPELLELEITETAPMHDPQRTASVLNGLLRTGVRVALDDFGTGYSSLSHLVRLPISTVKIDRSFVRDLLEVPEHAAVAASVVALGHRLDLTVVAEGVETRAENDYLRDEGCDAIQGYLFSKPLPAEECTKLLAAGKIVV